MPWFKHANYACDIGQEQGASQPIAVVAGVRGAGPPSLSLPILERRIALEFWVRRIDRLGPVVWEMPAAAPWALRSRSGWRRAADPPGSFPGGIPFSASAQDFFDDAILIR